MYFKFEHVPVDWMSIWICTSQRELCVGFKKKMLVLPDQSNLFFFAGTRHINNKQRAYPLLNKRWVHCELGPRKRKSDVIDTSSLVNNILFHIYIHIYSLAHILPTVFEAAKNSPRSRQSFGKRASRYWKYTWYHHQPENNQRIESESK